MGRQSRICGDTCGRPYEGRVDASQRVDTPAGSELEKGPLCQYRNKETSSEHRLGNIRV
jgi:hypothetical protein